MNTRAHPPILCVTLDTVQYVKHCITGLTCMGLLVSMTGIRLEKLQELEDDLQRAEIKIGWRKNHRNKIKVTIGFFITSKIKFCRV